ATPYLMGHVLHLVIETAQFEYEKSGKRVKMTYYAAPEEIFEDPEHAKEWADRAYKAALRQKAR
ncbi:MAG: TfoX/Sxy family protein, partial [Gammaproteobacteria bacterium]|nr:TfoX/Sxy family protein [Gammaproteobacteria bacterium]